MIEMQLSKQVIEDKRNAFVKMVFTPNRDADHKLNMFDTLIWQGFPLSDRFWYSLCCKTSFFSDLPRLRFLIDELVSNVNSNLNLNLEDKCIVLKILKTGTIEIEPLIIHPYIKISFVNLKTCKYLQKSNFDQPCILMNEKNMQISHNKTQNILELKESHLDFIPPLATPPNDLREKGESYAEWNEEFILNDEATNIYNTNTIIFFELLDFNFMSAFSSGSKNSPQNKIAWGYLKPCGNSQTYFGKFKIQLYKYKYKPTIDMRNSMSSNINYLRTPEVVYEFNWIKKEKYQTFLEIELRVEMKPRVEEMSNLFVQKKFRNSVFNPEGLCNVNLSQVRKKSKKKLKYEEFDHLAQAKRKLLLKRKKGENEDCIVPDKLLFKFSTGKLGCLTHEFSNNGKYLAACCTDLDSHTSIKVFNVEDGVLKYHFKGHQNLIHGLTWSKDDQMLISCSADNNVSLWQIPRDESNILDNTDYKDNARLFLLASISHPGYVYSVAIFPLMVSQESLVIASACFDGLVRVFHFTFHYADGKYSFIKHTLIDTYAVSNNTNNNKISALTLKNSKGFKLEDEKLSLLNKTVLDHRHPNSLAFDEIGRLYVGDSLGLIHILQVSLAGANFEVHKLGAIENKELEGDNINKLMIEPGDRKRLLVHSRDNCIRLIDVNKDKPKVIVRFFGAKCSRTNVKSAVSPDGQFILAGSEDGTPLLWSVVSGIDLGCEKFECRFNNPLCDVSWSSEYNMCALAAFGQEYPLLVYVHEKTDVVFDYKMKNKENLKFENEDRGKEHLSPLNDDISEFTKELKTIIEPQFHN